MASEIKVDTIVNAGGDNDTGIDLATNDQILLKVANATKLTMNSTGQVTIIGEGTATTNLQQGLVKAWADFSTSGGNTLNGSFNVGSITDIGTGDVYLNFTNNMNDAHYSGWAGGAAISLAYFDDQATNRQRHRAYSDLSTSADGSHRYFGVAGDLA
jgi:hypothetical protein